MYLYNILSFRSKKHQNILLKFHEKNNILSNQLSSFKYAANSVQIPVEPSNNVSLSSYFSVKPLSVYILVKSLYPYGNSELYKLNNMFTISFALNKYFSFL